MEGIMREKVTVKICGNEYEVKELTLAQKNKLLMQAGDMLRSLAGHAFFKKKDSGGISLILDDEISFAALNIDKIFLSSVEAMPELLRLAIPDFQDWDNLPESASREALVKAIEVQDIKGYLSNFFSLGTAIIR